MAGSSSFGRPSMGAFFGASSPMSWMSGGSAWLWGVSVALALVLAVLWWSLRRRAKAGHLESAAETDGVVLMLRTALQRSRAALQGQFDLLFSRGSIDDSLFEELEATLLGADVGMPTTQRFLDRLRAAWKAGERDPRSQKRV